MMPFPQTIAARNAQFEREFADIRPVGHARFLWAQSCGIVNLTTKGSSKLDVVKSLYRYPSPNRPAYSPSGPITDSCLNSDQAEYDIGYQTDLGFVGRSGRINCDAPSETTIGLRLCKRHQSSSRQLQYSVWLVASITMWNAAWPAQVRALWLLNCLARTVQVQWLSVRQLAFSVTTRAFAANLANCALAGRTTFRNRGQGASLAAVF